MIRDGWGLGTKGFGFRGIIYPPQKASRLYQKIQWAFTILGHLRGKVKVSIYHIPKAQNCLETSS